MEARDPSTGEMVGLFNPRAQRWEDRFEVQADSAILGTTSTGRATVELLQMNRRVALEIRHQLRLARRGPA